jgi:serine/threonine protein phosphatase PrpC
MEKLMLGEGIKTEASAGAKSKLGECFCYVSRGHEECGDSAFFYLDDRKAILGVFDGVSGESGAASASSIAASAVLESLRKKDRADERAIRKALSSASGAITKGYTTAVVAFIEKDGTALVAGVGDSPIYGVTKKGEVALELPLGRPVGDNDAVFKFFYFRNLVTSVLGPSGVDIHIHTRKGKLRKGEMLILASDCLNDNLFLKVKEGYIADSSGNEDLGKLIGKLRKPESTVKKIAKEIKRRVAAGKVEEEGRILVPKENDLAVIAFRFK